MKYFTLRKALLSLLLVGGILLTALTPLPQPTAVAPGQEGQKEADSTLQEQPPIVSDEFLDAWIKNEDQRPDDEVIFDVELLDHWDESTPYWNDEPSPGMLPIPMPEGVKGKEAMRKLLGDRLANRGYSQEINDLFYETLEALYQNYESWLPLYRDMPDVDTYVYDHLIAAIRYIPKAFYYDENTEEAQKMFDEGSPAGWVTKDDLGQPELHVIMPRPGVEEQERRWESLELFFHEVTHCHDMYLLDSESDYLREPDSSLADWLVEGSSTFHQKFVGPYTMDNSGGWSVMSNDQGLEIQYRKSNCIGYLINLNDYEKMIYLVGYETMERFTDGHTYFYDVKRVLRERYGQELADALLRTMAQRATLYSLEPGEAYEDDYENDKESDIRGYERESTFQASVELEKLFLRCVREDIARTNTLDELWTVTRLWVRYKECNLPFVLRESDWVVGDDYVENKKYYYRSPENNRFAYEEFIAEYDSTYDENAWHEDDMYFDDAYSYHRHLARALTLFDTDSVDEAIDQRLHELTDAQ